MTVTGRTLTMAAPPHNDPKWIDLLQNAGWLTAIGTVAGAISLLVKAVFVDRFKIKREAEQTAEEKRIAHEEAEENQVYTRLKEENARLDTRVRNLEKRLGEVEDRYTNLMTAKDRLLEEKNETIAKLDAELQAQILINNGLLRELNERKGMERTNEGEGI